MALHAAQGLHFSCTGPAYGCIGLALTLHWEIRMNSDGNTSITMDNRNGLSQVYLWKDFYKDQALKVIVGKLFLIRKGVVTMHEYDTSERA